MSVTRSSSLALALALAGSLAAPTTAAADDERVIAGVEGALFFPVSEPHVDLFYPGGTLSLATQFSVTNYLMPLFRARAGMLAPQAGNVAGAGYLASIMGGLRFRPRGIAHPEEPSRASCIWAEIDAGVGTWNGIGLPMFEAAIGYGFLVDDVTMGPVVRFTHALTPELRDGPDAFLMTVGLELLLNDAR